MLLVGSAARISLNDVVLLTTVGAGAGTVWPVREGLVGATHLKPIMLFERRRANENLSLL